MYVAYTHVGKPWVSEGSPGEYLLFDGKKFLTKTKRGDAKDFKKEYKDINLLLGA